jgi:hypothetical protein
MCGENTYVVKKVQPCGKEKENGKCGVLVHQQKNLGSFSLCQYVLLYVIHQPKAINLGLG